MSLRRGLVACVAAGAIATSSGCYSLAVNAHGLDRPVVVSDGPAPAGGRRFSHDVIVFYLLGLMPVMAFGGRVPTFTEGDRLVAAVLAPELDAGARGIVNLQVSQRVPAWLALAEVAGYTACLLADVRNAGALAALLSLVMFQPVEAHVEGHVVYGP